MSRNACVCVCVCVCLCLCLCLWVCVCLCVFVHLLFTLSVCSHDTEAIFHLSLCQGDHSLMGWRPWVCTSVVQTTVLVATCMASFHVSCMGMHSLIIVQPFIPQSSCFGPCSLWKPSVVVLATELCLPMEATLF